MNPATDIVCNLLERPFYRWKDEDKKKVLLQGRPTAVLSIFARKEIKKSGKSYNVNFKSAWFTNYKWLCSSQTLQKLYCWPCLLFSNKQSIWSKDGFVDILNITRALHKHTDSAEHLKCELILKTFEKNKNIIADGLKENARLYKLQFNENVRLNRVVLTMVIDAVLYLAKQELGFCGTDSVNQGNFKELLELLVLRSPLETRMEIQKPPKMEIMGCISDYMNEYIKKEVNEALFFSIQVDDTTDITQTSQCSLIIRFVNSEGLIVERFLGFHDISADRTSEALYTMLDRILNQFDYQNKLIGQSYDVSNIFCKSQWNSGIFPSGQQKRCHGLSSTYARRIPTVVEPGWCSNSKLVYTIVQEWDKLKEVFEFIITSEDSDQKSIQLARGFLNDMNDFDFTFLVVIFNDIFITTDILYDVLQKNSLDINLCVYQIKQTRGILSKKRNDDFFETIFNKASRMTELDITKRGYTGLSNKDVSTRYKALFYEIFDHILMEIDVRFQDCEKLKFVCLADTSKFEQYSSCFPSDVFENLEQFYGNIFTKYSRLKNELCLLYSDERYRNIPLQELLKKLNEYKDIFTEAYKLFCVILTIPSSASVEGGSSCLKRVKTYLKNTISQESLLYLATISIEKELLLELKKNHPFYEDIIDKFASLEDRKIDLVYKI
ncbi:hypothetical protein NQ317_011665 [Molorchus minor]|uniref:DUF4371 domain-containing protein n=1 Tax=Molorchus minor TaxID=1323400 RepID=A0ABQ9JGT4_9CUCU|nr:hypothetical protein NQ317_011665 [Molorchus minor]